MGLAQGHFLGQVFVLGGQGFASGWSGRFGGLYAAWGAELV